MEAVLWEHQRLGIEQALKGFEYAFFFDPGCGKTLTTIEVLRHHFRVKKKVRPTLILAPIVVLEQWKQEFAKFSKIPQHQIFVCYEDGPKRLRQIQNAVSSSQGECIIITNYETLLIEKCFGELFKWQPRILICDESHRCKSYTAKRSKKAEQLADRATYRYLLTGTPITNNPLDIFQQFRILDGGKTFGTSFFAFRHEWFEDVNAKWKMRGSYFPNWQIQKLKLPLMNELIYRKAMRAIKSECLDLPPLVKTRIEVKLSTEQKRLYEEMRKHFIAFVDSEITGRQSAITASQAVVKALRLQQIVTGFCKLEDGSIQRIKENPRLDALYDLLEDLTINNKIIVWCNFRENYNQIRDVCEKLGVKYSELHGDLVGNRQAEIDNFRNKPEYKVLISNQGSGGVGLNLIEAAYSIYYSKGFNLEFDVQSEARNYRGGSTMHQKITRIDLVAPQTIDEIINVALEKKQNIIDNLIELKNQLQFSNLS